MGRTRHTKPGLRKHARVRSGSLNNECRKFVFATCYSRRAHLSTTKPFGHDFAAFTITRCFNAASETCESHVSPCQSPSVVCELGRVGHDRTHRRMDKWFSNHAPTGVCHWLHTKLFELGHEPVFTRSCVSVSPTGDNHCNIKTSSSSLAKHLH